MFRHNFYKGNNRYNIKNKTIILVIRKQPGEIDWIMPVLNYIQNKFNIIVIFEKKIALELLKENEILFSFFLDAACCYFTHSIFKNFFLRIINKIFHKILSFSSPYLNDKIYKNFYNLREIETLCNNNGVFLKLDNIKILMQDFTDNSPWIKKFFETYKNTKIVSYPHTTNIFSQFETKKSYKNKSYKNNYLLVNSKLDLRHLENKLNYSNIFLAGYPKYDPLWLSKIEKKINYKKSKNSLKIIFVAFKGYDKKFYDKINYELQLKSLFDYVSERKNFKLVFKFHPKAQEEKVFLNIANKYPKKIWKITKDHLHVGSFKSDIFISFFRNASILDALANNKIPIELWNTNSKKRNKLLKIKPNEKSHYQKLNLCISPINSSEMFILLDKFFYKKKFYLKRNPLQNFKKLCVKKNSIKKISDLLTKISNHH